MSVIAFIIVWRPGDVVALIFWGVLALVFSLWIAYAFAYAAASAVRAWFRRRFGKGGPS